MNEEIKIRLAEIQLEINSIKQEMDYADIGNRLELLEAEVFPDEEEII